MRVMFFELFLIMMSGTLGVEHHYWWQGLDEYWFAIGGIFSALEPLPLGGYELRHFGRGQKFCFVTDIRIVLPVAGHIP